MSCSPAVIEHELYELLKTKQRLGVLQDKLHEIDARLTHCTTVLSAAPRGKGDTDKIGALIALKEDLIQQYARQKRQDFERFEYWENRINSLLDKNQRAVLTHLYLFGKSWGRTASVLRLSKRSVAYYRRKAIHALAASWY